MSGSLCGEGGRARGCHMLSLWGWSLPLGFAMITKCDFDEIGGILKLVMSSFWVSKLSSIALPEVGFFDF